MVELATCFDSARSSSRFYVKQIMLKKLPTSLGSLFIVELATCFDPARSSSRLYVNQVRLKNCVHQWDPKDVRSSFKHYLIHIKD